MGDRKRAKQTCKPGSVSRLHRDGDHLSSPAVAGRVERPTRGQAGRPLCPPIWPCSGWGLPSQPVSRLLVGSYLTISPLPWKTRAVCFCGTFHRVTPSGRYPASCPEEPGLSSLIRIGAAARSTWPIYTLGRCQPYVKWKSAWLALYTR